MFVFVQVALAGKEAEKEQVWDQNAGVDQNLVHSRREE